MKTRFCAYKILIIFFGVLFLFTGCAGNTAFTLKKDFSRNAVYKAGNFSFLCKIVKSGDAVSVTALSTSAAGLTISCDGADVSFRKDKMMKRFQKEKIDSTNPAVVLYEVFSSAKNDSAYEKSKDNKFYRSGKTSVGNFTLAADKDGNTESIALPDAQIEIIFN